MRELETTQLVSSEQRKTATQMLSSVPSSQHQKQATREKPTKTLQQTEQKATKSKRQMLHY
jgi:hypothetical protein